VSDVEPITIAIVNWNSHWMPKFWTRAETGCAALRRRGVDLIAAQELGTYDNARHLSHLMGWGGKRVTDDKNPQRDQTCVLHGGFVPVATGLIWNPEKIRAIQCGQGISYKDWSRNKWFTWADLLVFGKRGRFEVSHLEFEPKGPNTIKKYDTIRFKQADGILNQMKKVGRTNILMADANCDLDDARDGFGNALHGHGMKDFDEMSKGRRNTTIGTAKTTWARGGRIIRGGATPDVEGTYQDVLDVNGWTDHNVLIQKIKIPV